MSLPQEISRGSWFDRYTVKLVRGIEGKRGVTSKFHHGIPSTSIGMTGVNSFFVIRALSFQALARQICQWQGFAPMKLPASLCATLVLPFWAASAQTPAPEAAKSAEATQIEALAKKIDEQNAKIDSLSQEILKLEQQISHLRPGIMIGESTPSPANPAAPAASALHPAAAGNTHIVARGETLTSIAKMYKVTVDELQKANHIEDGRKLQAGQTISIPTSATPTPTPAG